MSNLESFNQSLITKGQGKNNTEPYYPRY